MVCALFIEEPNNKFTCFLESQKIHKMFTDKMYVTCRGLMSVSLKPTPKEMVSVCIEHQSHSSAFVTVLNTTPAEVPAVSLY
jgi:hypothetical protein